MKSPRRLALVFAVALAAAVSVAAQTPTVTPTAVDSEAIGKITDAIATGNAAQLAEYSRPYREPVADTAHAALNTTLARAWLFLGDTARALNFAKAAYTYSPDPVPRWLAAELLYARGNWNAADLLAVALKNRDPSSPIVPYLEARYILARLADADAGFEQPMMVDAKRDLLAATAACTSTQSRAHPDFDPRFLSLSIDVGLLDLNYAAAAGYAAELSALRPRNAPLARLALSLALGSPDFYPLLVLVRMGDTLPAAELTLWKLNATLIDQAPVDQKGSAWLSLADTAKKNPPFAPVYIHLIARAAALLPEDDARCFPTRDAYMEAALQARSAPHARAALRLRPPDASAAARERRIALATLASRHDLAAALTLKEAPLHADDFDWLMQHRPFAARAQEFGVYIQYLKIMERLRPDAPLVLLEIARVYDQHTLPGALDYYARAFAAVPSQIRPTLQDWFAYETLAREADRDHATAQHRPADAEALFDATTERIHADAPADVPAAWFYANLLDRSAQLSKKSADHEAAEAAEQRARELDPEAGKLLELMRAKA